MRCSVGHDGLLGCVLGLGRGLEICDVRLSCGLIGADGPERLQVVGHYGIADVNRGSLRGNLQLPGNAGGAVAGNHVGGVRDADLLVGGCGPLSRIRRIEPSHRIAVGIRDLVAAVSKSDVGDRNRA